MSDREAWERQWAEVLAEHGEAIAGKPPHERLVATAEDLPPGRALDAGCGHGAEALWLAARGWRVTAVDFSAAALAHGATTAASLGVADRVDWVEGDLGAWAPAASAYDLVSCLYVHVAGSIEELVSRLSTGVAPGGTLLMLGHLPVDRETGEPSRAAGQVQVTVEAATRALSARAWRVEASEVPRRAGGTDAVVRAVRLSPAGA
jgi:SAM-dependent methyltransferase